MPGSEGGISPFFSPDGQWIGFFTMDGKLKKVPVGDGESFVICPAIQSRTGTWLPDNTIVFDSSTGLRRVSADGGTPSPLTTLAPGKGEIVHWAPRWIDNTRRVIFTVHSQTGSRVAAVSLDGGAHRELLDGTSPIGVVAGYLFHARGSALVATPFDVDRLTATGAPLPVINDIRQAGPRVLADMTADGTVAYQPAFSGESALVWVDRVGNVTPTPAPRGAYDAPRLSPDSRRAAVAIADGDKTDVWVIDLDRGTRIRLTKDGYTRSPLWLPDGRILVTTSGEDGRRKLLAIPADGSAPGQRMVATERLLHADSVSPDGRIVAITEQPVEAVQRLSLGRGSVLLLPGGGPPRPLLPTAADARNAVFSPNGRWIAYVSEESGNHHVYLQPADGSGAKIAVSTSMGWQPVWSRDGRELYYRGSNRIMRATIDATSGRASSPSELFDSAFTSFRGADFFRAQYDVTHDGRFLMIQSEGPGDQVRVILSIQTEIARVAGSPGRRPM